MHDDEDERGFFAEQRPPAMRSVKPADEKPHYLGHRQRLRERFRQAGADALSDYEILELLLFRSIPRSDTKGRAKALLRRFGSLAEVLGAPEHLLRGRAYWRGSGGRPENRGCGCAAHGTQRNQGPRDPFVMEPGARLLPRRHGFRGARAVPHSLTSH
jgi:hypothetical protein